MRTFKPTLTATVPDGWFVKESITLLEPKGKANVIASSEPVDEGLDTEAYARTQGELLRSEFSGYEEIAFEPIRIFGGRDGRVRHFEWTPPDGDSVAQVQLYLVEAGRGYTATATAGARDFPQLEQRLWDVLEELSIPQRWGEAEPTELPIAAQVTPEAGV